MRTRTRRPHRSHRERARERTERHPERAEFERQVSVTRQEIARLRRLYGETSDPSYLAQTGILEDELFREAPMPKVSLEMKLVNRIKKGTTLPSRRLKKLAALSRNPRA